MRKRLAWRLRHRDVAETAILGVLLKAQQLTFALVLYLEWLESHSENAAEKDVDFHVKLANPNEAYTPFPEKRRCVLVFGDEASHILAGLGLSSIQTASPSAVSHIPFPPLKDWPPREWLGDSPLV